METLRGTLTGILNIYLGVPSQNRGVWEPEQPRRCNYMGTSLKLFAEHVCCTGQDTPHVSPVVVQRPLRNVETEVPNLVAHDDENDDDRGGGRADDKDGDGAEERDDRCTLMDSALWNKHYLCCAWCG